MPEQRWVPPRWVKHDADLWLMGWRQQQRSTPSRPVDQAERRTIARIQNGTARPGGGRRVVRETDE